ncbi:MAG: permease [Gemmatimonadetes bacterium]|nr:permease [Gemmatimonadota bacterium]
MKQDALFALRGFRRTPGFAIATTLILAIGIGMAAATVTIYDAVLLRRLPVVAQDRVILPRVFDRVGVAVDLFPPQVTALGRDAQSMHGVAGVMHAGAVDNPLLDAGRPVAVRWTTVTGNFFDVLGTRPYLGRLIAMSDDAAGARYVMVLSYAAWTRHFGADSSIVGHQLTSPSYDMPITIIGVAPPGLDYPIGVGGWVANGAFPGVRMMNIVARLSPSATPAGAAAELLEFMRHTDAVTATYVATAKSVSETLPQAIVGDVRPALRMLGISVALLLLIVCVNVGNLLLSRMAGRARELTVRRALGATATDIARQLIVESALLAVAGGVLGFACAEGLLRLVVAAAPPELPRLDMIGLGWAPLAWCAATTLITLAVFGVVPALLATHGDLATPLRSDSRSGGESRGRRRFRHGLVASQVALAMVVLTGGGLLARSFIRLERMRLGYEPEHLSFVQVSLPWGKIGGSYARMNAIYDGIERQLRAVPGVISVTPSLAAPYSLPDLFLMKVTAENGVAATRDEHPLLPLTIGGPELFRTLGISLVRGRGFQAGEGSETSPRVVVVSEATARLLWPGENPIGKRLRAAYDTTARAWATVVGVAADVRYRRLKDIQPVLYTPWRQYVWQGNIAIRTARPLASMQREIERAIHDSNSDTELGYAHPASDYLGTVLAQPRMTAALLSSLGLVATLLAAIGLYAIMAAAVREQTREIGVRMALGATPERVRGEVLTTALRVIGTGGVAGLILALAGGRLLSKLLFEVSPVDPISFGGAIVVLGGTAFVAAYLPARRATRIDPVRALRAE